MLITPEEISHITGCPLKNAQKYWPLMIQELQRRGKNKLSFQVALLATVGVESGTFKPVTEWFPPSWGEERARAYFNKQYSNRKDLGNRGWMEFDPDPKIRAQFKPEYRNDGWKYRGHGFIQLTGLANAKKYGKRMGLDLVNHPELGLKDKESVQILVDFAITHGLDVWAERAYNSNDSWDDEKAWEKIRRLVNGGLTHYSKFRALVTHFMEAGSQEGTNV